MTTTADNQRVYLDNLSKRWLKSADEVVEMAINGVFDLWFEFTNVIVLRVKKKKKPGEPQFHEHIEVRPRSEVLGPIIGRCEQMQVAAEYPCLNEKGKPVLVSNFVGEEWGQTSMIGLNPMRLFARLDDLLRVERKNDITPFTVEAPPACSSPEDVAQAEPMHQADDGELISPDHPCFAPELHIALECWLELMAEEDQPDAVSKADILAWLYNHYPELSKTASQRIALVVSPGSKPQQ